MKKEELKKRKMQEGGITLVALVVTIIILLILAGVTLNLALGEGGIFARAKNIVDKYQSAQENELGQLASLEKDLDKYGQGGTTPVTPPIPQEPRIEVTYENLKEYQGKYVDIGLDVNENTDTTDDWELFYATDDRIFLIAADYVPATKLTEWGIIGDSGSLKDNGFQQYSTYKYSVSWTTPTTFLEDLPDLNLVMHNGYNLVTNKANPNSIAVSHLLNKDKWNGIKVAADKSDYIDFVIGGPTLEMWCAAWVKAVEEDSDFAAVEANPQASGTGYEVKINGKSSGGTYVGSSGSEPDLTKLAKYNTFFPHTATYEDCNCYWLASPSASRSDCVMGVDCFGRVSSGNYQHEDVCVRPLVSLISGVQIVERADEDNIYDLATE